MKKIIFITLTLLLFGCATPKRKISDDAAKVQFQSQKSTLLSSCKRLERLEASSRDWAKVNVREETENQLREQAVLMGADTVVITNEDGDYIYEYKAQAIGFKCFD
jgi:hypothetical protein